MEGLQDFEQYITVSKKHLLLFMDRFSKIGLFQQDNTPFRVVTETELRL